MKYEYSMDAKASKLLLAKDMLGLPSDISLSFNNVYVRFYKSSEMNGYFYCKLAIPAFQDDEGYVFEREFCAITEDDEDDDIDLSTYLNPFNDHTFDSLPNSATCYFEEKTEMGQRMLLLFMRIKGTPFYGYVLIDQDFYVKAKNK